MTDDITRQFKILIQDIDLTESELSEAHKECMFNIKQPFHNFPMKHLGSINEKEQELIIRVIRSIKIHLPKMTYMEWIKESCILLDTFRKQCDGDLDNIEIA